MIYKMKIKNINKFYDILQNSSLENNLTPSIF